MGEDKKFDISKAKGNAPLLASEFIKQSPPIVVSQNDIYLWNGKFYDILSTHIAHQRIMKFFQDNNIIPAWKFAKAEEMLKVIKYFPTTTNIPLMDDYANLINLNNCVYNLDTNETLSQDSKYFFSYAIDVDYNKDAEDHPHFSKFIQDLFMQPNGQPDIDTMRLILFIMAYLIYPQIKIPKMFTFLGGGSNGKSVLIEIIKMFFPKKYITSLSLGIISNSESFSRNSLSYSRLNITTEEKVGKKVESEEIKKVISGEQIPIRKLYNEPIEAYPKTKLLLAANEFFYLNDNSDGAFRRLCIIEFKNQFKNKSDYEREKNPRERSIYLSSMEEEILDNIRKEKSAIFNTLMTYLNALRKDYRWDLPTTKNTQDILEEYKAGADTLGTWLAENYELADYGESDPRAITATTILNDFKDYYEVHYPGKRFTYSVGAIGKKIKQLFRIDPERRNRSIMSSGGVKTERVRVYHLKRKDDNLTPNDNSLSLNFPAPARQSSMDDEIDPSEVEF